MIKCCPDCGETKPLTEFYTEPKTRWNDGYCLYCKNCKRNRTNAYRAAKRDEYNAGNRRSYHLRKRKMQT